MKEYKADDFKTSCDKGDFLGRGSYASVRRCFHHELGSVVVKCFNLTGSDIAIKNNSHDITKEAEVLYEIKHENIIDFLGITTWSTCYGIVMEEAAGHNLEDLVIHEKDKNISWPLRLRFFTEIADGLEYLHYHDPQCSYVHGDLKLQNILLTDSLHIKIADFGAVTILRASGASTASLDFAPSKQFTWLYSAPELLNNPEMKRTCELDVYSYAMMGYEIITRKQVFLSSENTNCNVVWVLVKEKGQKPNLEHIKNLEDTLTNQNDLTILGNLKKTVVQSWCYDPEKRISIKDVKDILENTSLFEQTEQSDKMYFMKRKMLSYNTTPKTSLNNFQPPFETAQLQNDGNNSNPHSKFCCHEDSSSLSSTIFHHNSNSEATNYRYRSISAQSSNLTAFDRNPNQLSSADLLLFNHQPISSVDVVNSWMQDRFDQQPYISGPRSNMSRGRSESALKSSEPSHLSIPSYPSSISGFTPQHFSNKSDLEKPKSPASEAIYLNETLSQTEEKKPNYFKSMKRSLQRLFKKKNKEKSTKISTSDENSTKSQASVQSTSKTSLEVSSWKKQLPQRIGSFHERPAYPGSSYRYPENIEPRFVYSRASTPTGNPNYRKKKVQKFRSFSSHGVGLKEKRYVDDVTFDRDEKSFEKSYFRSLTPLPRSTFHSSLKQHTTAVNPDYVYYNPQKTKFKPESNYSIFCPPQQSQDLFPQPLQPHPQDNVQSPSQTNHFSFSPLTEQSSQNLFQDYDVSRYVSHHPLPVVQKPKALYGQPFASAYFQQNTTPHKVDQPQVNRDHEFDNILTTSAQREDADNNFKPTVNSLFTKTNLSQRTNSSQMQYFLNNLSPYITNSEARKFYHYCSKQSGPEIFEFLELTQKKSSNDSVFFLKICSKLQEILGDRFSARLLFNHFNSPHGSFQVVDRIVEYAGDLLQNIEPN